MEECRAMFDEMQKATDSPDVLRARSASGGLSAHILPASATMIGVCMTVLTIGHLGPRGDLLVVVDKLLAGDAILFLLSAFLSFLAMRSRYENSLHETRAEWVFVIGLGLLTLIAGFLAFAIN
jgi:hypothetical protein